MKILAKVCICKLKCLKGLNFKIKYKLSKMSRQWNVRAYPIKTAYQMWLRAASTMSILYLDKVYMLKLKNMRNIPIKNENN